MGNSHSQSRKRSSNRNHIPNHPHVNYRDQPVHTHNHEQPVHTHVPMYRDSDGTKHGDEWRITECSHGDPECLGDFFNSEGQIYRWQHPNQAMQTQVQMQDSNQGVQTRVHDERQTANNHVTFSDQSQIYQYDVNIPVDPVVVEPTQLPHTGQFDYHQFLNNTVYV